MDATDALAVLRQQHADFEDNKLTSEDPDLTIVIEFQQRELEKHISFLENAVQAREIAQIDLRSLRIIDNVRVQEQQALDDRRFAALQAGRVLDLTSVQTRMREGEAVAGHFSPAYIRAASQPLLVGRERFLSEDTSHVRTSPACPVNIILEPEQGEPISHTLEDATRGDGAHERPVTTLRSHSHGLSPISAEGTSDLVQLAGNATSVKERSHGKNLTTMKLGPKSCIACCEDTVAVRRLDMECGHSYCQACLVFLVQLAVDDVSVWPAKCCNTITPKDTAKFLLPKLQARYAARSIEWNVEDPTYCNDPKCACFIVEPPGKGAERLVLTCPKCQKETCTHCKKASHQGGCVKEELPDELKQLMKDEEWQRCPKCERLVGLSDGCNHITCLAPCVAQFCYDCAVEWKHCKCPQWRVDRLLSRAARAAIRDDNDDDPEVAAQGFRDLVEQIREAGATCDHTGLHRVEWPGVCDDCGQLLDKYLYRGCECRLEICLWCRDTRQGLFRLRDQRQLPGQGHDIRRQEAHQWVIARDRGVKMTRRYMWQGIPNTQRPDMTTAMERAGRVLNTDRMRAAEVIRVHADQIRRTDIAEQQALLRRLAPHEDA